MTMQTDSITHGEQWLEKLERAACFGDAELAACIQRLERSPSISLPALSGPVLRELADAAAALAFRPARSEVGKPERRVYQEFGYCDAVPADHPVAYLGDWMTARLQRALRGMSIAPMPRDFAINDVVCQAYQPGDLGITPHRDHVRYTYLVTLIVLQGRGRYFTCSDRRGGDRREIPSDPGRVILMPGPGFAGRSERPFHMVGEISEQRYSVGLRHDAHKAGQAGQRGTAK